MGDGGQSVQAAAPTNPGPLVTVASVLSAHGTRGEVRLRLETDFPERLASGRRVWLDGPAPRWSAIESARPVARGVFLVCLAGVDDREAARSLAGYRLQVPASDLPPLPDGQYYHHQIVGLGVYDEDGTALGEVMAIERTGANDVYVVRRPDGSEWLLPAVRDVVREIDLTGRRLVVRPIPGMLD